jgi:hypothetical protein
MKWNSLIYMRYHPGQGLDELFQINGPVRQSESTDLEANANVQRFA